MTTQQQRDDLYARYVHASIQMNIRRKYFLHFGGKRRKKRQKFNLTQINLTSTSIFYLLHDTLSRIPDSILPSAQEDENFMPQSLIKVAFKPPSTN